MQNKNNSQALKFKIPWLTILIVLIWLLVLGMVAKRYFTAKKSHGFIETESDSSSAPNNLAIFDRNLLISNAINLDASMGYIDKSHLQVLRVGQKSQQINLLRQALYTPLGEVHAIYENNSQRYTLFFNQIPLGQLDSPYVLYAFELINNHTVLIFDAEVVSGDPIYTILDIQAQSKFIIHEAGNYRQLLTADLNPGNNCIDLKFQDASQAAAGEDYQSYRYCGNGNVYKVHEVKPVK